MFEDGLNDFDRCRQYRFRYGEKDAAEMPYDQHKEGDSCGPRDLAGYRNEFIVTAIIGHCFCLSRLVLYQATQLRDIFVEFRRFFDGKLTRARQVDGHDLADHGRAR